MCTTLDSRCMTKTTSKKDFKKYSTLLDQCFDYPTKTEWVKALLVYYCVSVLDFCVLFLIKKIKAIKIFSALKLMSLIGFRFESPNENRFEQA